MRKAEEMFKQHIKYDGYAFHRMIEIMKEYAKQCVEADRMMLGADIDMWAHSIENGSVVCDPQKLMDIEIITP